MLTIMSILILCMERIGINASCEDVTPSLRDEAAPAKCPLSVGETFKEYVGKGSYGEVYKGSIDGTPLVKKIIAKELCAKETETLKRLQSVSGVPTLYECEICHTKCYIYQQSLYKDMSKMEVIKKLREKGFLKRMKLYRGPVETLIGISNNGFVHNDIKPENLMANSEEITEIFTIDYGLARKIDDEVSFRGGTLAYRSPELLISSEYCPTSIDDNYSLGMSIAAIELSSVGRFFIEDYNKCMKTKEYELCHKDLLLDIKYEFEHANFKQKEECGQQSVQLFGDALTDSVESTHKYRLSPQDLLIELDLSIKLCERFIASKESTNQQKDKNLISTKSSSVTENKGNYPILDLNLPETKNYNMPFKFMTNNNENDNDDDTKERSHPNSLVDLAKLDSEVNFDKHDYTNDALTNDNTKNVDKGIEQTVPVVKKNSFPFKFGPSLPDSMFNQQQLLKRQERKKKLEQRKEPELKVDEQQILI